MLKRVMLCCFCSYIMFYLDICECRLVRWRDYDYIKSSVCCFVGLWSQDTNSRFLWLRGTVRNRCRWSSVTLFMPYPLFGHINMPCLYVRPYGYSPLPSASSAKCINKWKCKSCETSNEYMSPCEFVHMCSLFAELIVNSYNVHTVTTKNWSYYQLANYTAIIAPTSNNCQILVWYS